METEPGQNSHHAGRKFGIKLRFWHLWDIPQIHLFDNRYLCTYIMCWFLYNMLPVIKTFSIWKIQVMSSKNMRWTTLYSFVFFLLCSVGYNHRKCMDRTQSYLLEIFRILLIWMKKVIKDNVTGIVYIWRPGFRLCTLAMHWFHEEWLYIFWK